MNIKFILYLYIVILYICIIKNIRFLKLLCFEFSFFVYFLGVVEGGKSILVK